MITALWMSSLSLAGDGSVTVQIGDEVAQVDTLGIYPVGLSGPVEGFRSTTLSYTGVGKVQILGALADVRGTRLSTDELTLLPSGGAQLEGDVLSPGEGGGVQLVPCADAEETGLVIAADEASMAEVVSTTGTAVATLGGVQQAYGSTTLAGDRDALQISADFSALGIDTCRIVAGLGKELRIAAERPCSDIGTVTGDGLSFKHFNTDYHEHDYGHYWTWGSFVFNVYDVRFYW